MLRPLIVIPIAVLLVLGAVELAVFDTEHYDEYAIQKDSQYQELVSEFKGYINGDKITQFNKLTAESEDESAAISNAAFSDFAYDYCDFLNIYERLQTENITADRGFDKINAGIFPQTDVPRFEKLKIQGEKLSSGPKIYFMPEQAVENTIQDKYYIIIMLVTISILLCGVFPYEKKNGTIKLLKSTKCGLRGIVLHKLFSGCIGTALISIIFSIIQDVFIITRLDMAAMPAAFQSIKIFGDSMFCLSITQYLLLSALLRLIGSVFFGLIIMAFSCLCRHSMWALGFGAALIALSSYFEGLMNTDFTLNPFTLCSAFRPLMKFSPIVIFGRAFEATTVSYCASVLLCAAIFALIVFIFKRNRKAEV